MAIDARIPLGAQASNIGDLVMNFANDMERSQQLEKANERADKQFNLQSRALDAQTSAARTKAMSESRKRSQEAAVALTARLAAQKDPNARLKLLQGHRQWLTNRQEVEPWVTTTETDEMLAQLQRDPESFERNLAGEVQAMRQLKQLAEAPETFTTEMRNGVPVQVSSRSKRAYDVPGTPTSTERAIGGLAGVLAGERAEAARLRNEQLRRTMDREQTEAQRKAKEREETQIGELHAKRDAYSSAVNSSEQTKQDIAYAKELVNWRSTGVVGSLMRQFGANDAADLGLVLEKLKGRNAFAALADLASKGIKLTPISNDEVKLAAATVAALDANASPSLLNRELNATERAHNRITKQSRIGLARSMKKLKELVPNEVTQSAADTAETGEVKDDELIMLERRLEELQKAAKQ